MDYIKNWRRRFLGHLFTAPFILGILPALIITDMLVSLYQAVCFPIYGIKKLRRKDYILIMDRNKLQYLRPLEKLFCMYCGYANGLLVYLKEIAGLTEKYWCGVMHENKPGFKQQASQKNLDFSKFGDKKDFEEKYGPR